MPDAEDKELVHRARFALAAVELLIVYVTGFVFVTGVFGSTGQLPYAAAWAVYTGFYIFLASMSLLATLWVLGSLSAGGGDMYRALGQCVCEAMSSSLLVLTLACVALLYDSYYSDRTRAIAVGDGWTGGAAIGSSLAFLLVALLVSSYTALVAAPTGQAQYAFMSPEGLLVGSLTVDFVVARARDCQDWQFVFIPGALAMGWFAADARRFFETRRVFKWVWLPLAVLAVAAQAGAAVAAWSLVCTVATVALFASAVAIMLGTYGALESPSKVGLEGASYQPIPKAGELELAGSASQGEGLVWRVPSMQRGKKRV